jgi:hypothetical protein
MLLGYAMAVAIAAPLPRAPPGHAASPVQRLPARIRDIFKSKGVLAMD